MAKGKFTCRNCKVEKSNTESCTNCGYELKSVCIDCCEDKPCKGL